MCARLWFVSGMEPQSWARCERQQEARLEAPGRGPMKGKFEPLPGQPFAVGWLTAGKARAKTQNALSPTGVGSVELSANAIQVRLALPGPSAKHQGAVAHGLFALAPAHASQVHSRPCKRTHCSGVAPRPCGVPQSQRQRCWRRRVRPRKVAPERFGYQNSPMHRSQASNPSIERTSQRPLRALWPAAHVER